MQRNDHDVTNRIRTTDGQAVCREVLGLHRALYPGAPDGSMRQAFADLLHLYEGRHPAFHACETPYHDIQHVLDVTLAMARLMDGYERGRAHSAPLAPALFGLGILCALFHDVGYLRRRGDRRRQHGAQYTLTHVGRSAAFLRRYLPGAGLGAHAAAASTLLHFTGHERPVEAIRVGDPLLRRIGQMLGTADLIAQMSDRCYLEKRRDRLYPELAAGGLAHRLARSGGELVRRTHAFCLAATQRLDLQLARAYDYAARHFSGQNLYLEAMQRNVRYALVVARDGHDGRLRRVPPASPIPRQ
jgi:hypothetical protein